MGSDKQDEEPNRLSKRALRYAHVSAAAAGVGARYVTGRALGNKGGGQAEALAHALGGLKGPVMKIAQLLSTIPEAVPEPFALAFAKLQADAPPMGPAFVKRRLRAELGPDWESRFRSFDLNAAAAASLGQVHKAVGLDGRNLAIKLQYPDMASVVEADLHQLRFALGLYERFDPTLSMDEVQAELADRLREELDYAREAKHLALFGHMLHDEKGVRVPDLIPELSTPRLLAMEWLDGARLSDVAQSAGQEARNQIAINMYRAWYVPFYEYGVLHGDPHLGNYSIGKNKRVNLLDYGCLRVFEPSLVQGVLWLYESLLHDKPDLAVEAYKAWGFKDPSRELIEVLNVWARFVYAPLLEDKCQKIEETNAATYGREVAKKVHCSLRSLGKVSIPRPFVLIDRASLGLGSVFLKLRAEINWHRLFLDVVDAFDLPTLETRQNEALNKVGLRHTV